MTEPSSSTKQAPDTSNTGDDTKIVVGYAGSPGSSALSEAASTLAKALAASLHGIFVRDEDIRNLAALPFAKAAAPGQAGANRIVGEHVEQSWQQEEAICRQHLVRSAAAHAVPVQFSAQQGHLAACYCTHLSTRDVIAISTEAFGPVTRNIQAQMSSLRDRARAILIAGHADLHRSRLPVLAIDDGDQLGAETIQLAAKLARSSNRQLIILALTDSVDRDKIEARAQALTAPSTVTIFSLAHASNAELAHVIKRIHPGFIVADLEGLPFGGNPEAVSLIRSIGTPILLLSKKALNHKLKTHE